MLTKKIAKKLRESEDFQRLENTRTYTLSELSSIFNLRRQYSWNYFAELGHYSGRTILIQGKVLKGYITKRAGE